MARLLDPQGELICQLRTLVVAGSVGTSGTPFTAIVDDESGFVIRIGQVLVEMDDGSRHAAAVANAEVIAEDIFGSAIQISGVFGRGEKDR